MNGNKEEGVIIWEVQDQEIRMNLDFRAMSNIEQELGLESMQETMRLFTEDNLSYHKIEAIFWACLNSAKNGLSPTIDETSDLIQADINENGGDYSHLMEVVAELINSSTALPNAQADSETKEEGEEKND